MSFIFWEKTKNTNLENYTLILPAIAVGNVGQLAIDLLLRNLNVDNLAYLHHPCFLPFAGADAFDPQSDKLSTSCQMYECKEKRLVIIQHRAPLVNSRVKEYLDFLTKFIKDHKIKRTIMLSSSFSQYFAFEQLENVPLHYLCSSNVEDESRFGKLSWKKFNLALPHVPAVPGGGISKLFLDMCEEQNIPVVVLIMVCSEGDNYSEAYQMVSNLNKWLQIKEGDSEKIRWVQPFSWSYPYANDAPAVMY
uniref:Proteasome assembly chaperone 2 n=1 Tax=Parasteatoda tepidariorum TaxID=114398 RepID=A0A2L2YFP1_PARTP